MKQPRPAHETSPVQELLARLAELSPLLRASAAEADRLARLPQAVSAALIRHGLLRLWMPKAVAGFELSLPDALTIYEAAARIDGSAGWAVMIGSGGGLFAAYLDSNTAHTLYSRPDAVIAGSGAPDGRAERVEGGYRATGCWRYASGAHYATTFTANCLILDKGTLVLGSDGKPLVRAMAFDSSEVTVLPAWDTSGMRGTGSDDFEVRDVFVPEARTFSVFTDSAREPGPLYRLPFGVLTELPVAAVALGIARHALDAFAELARRKKSGDSTLSRDPLVQSRFAEVHATILQIKAALAALADRAWQATLANESLSVRELAEGTAVCSLAVSGLRAAVDELIALSGMTGVQTEDDLARTWRDLQTVAAHGSVSPRHLLRAGASLLSGDA